MLSLIGWDCGDPHDLYLVLRMRESPRDTISPSVEGCRFNRGVHGLTFIQMSEGEMVPRLLSRFVPGLELCLTGCAPEKAAVVKSHADSARALSN